MPYKAEKIIIEKTQYDRRVKLTPEQKDEIREQFALGFSQRKLAKIYGVDRRLISFIVNPESHEENLKRRDERGGSRFYYEKEKHRNYVKKHRRYKHTLKLQGKIQLKEEQ